MKKNIVVVIFYLTKRLIRHKDKKPGLVDKFN